VQERRRGSSCRYRGVGEGAADAEDDARELVQERRPASLSRGGGRRARPGAAAGKLVQGRWPASSSRGGGRRARPRAAAGELVQGWWPAISCRGGGRRSRSGTAAGDLIRGRRTATSFRDGGRRSRSGTAGGNLVQDGGQRALQGWRRSRLGAPALIVAGPAQALIALVER
jgi:hypothetical protein